MRGLIRELVTTALDIAAAALLVAGIALIYTPAAFIAAGVALLALSWALTPRAPRPDSEAPPS